jgi:hypothetical protein
MPNDSDSAGARNLTLQKIGRNVVNFQKMEAMLKFILTVANFSVPLSTAQSHLRGQSKRVRKRSMGQLIEQAAKTLHSDAPKAPPDIKEIWISHSFSLKEGGSKIADWRREMRRVVKERNALIHHMVASWNPHSSKSCSVLCEELDQQRERILPSYNHLESVVSAIRESHGDLARAADEIGASILGERYGA